LIRKTADNTKTLCGEEKGNTVWKRIMADGDSTENTAWLSTTSDSENTGNCAWIRIRTD
jgi:hypothetical protein